MTAADMCAEQFMEYMAKKAKRALQHAQTDHDRKNIQAKIEHYYAALAALKSLR